MYRCCSCSWSTNNFNDIDRHNNANYCPKCGSSVSWKHLPHKGTSWWDDLPAAKKENTAIVGDDKNVIAIIGKSVPQKGE